MASNRRHPNKWVTPYRDRWRAQVYCGPFEFQSLGVFDTPERGQLAVRLFKYWMSQGFSPTDIPRQPVTRDAI